MVKFLKQLLYGTGKIILPIIWAVIKFELLYIDTHSIIASYYLIVSLFIKLSQFLYPGIKLILLPELLE